MKLTRVVKLQRVKYSELDEGDRFMIPEGMGIPYELDGMYTLPLSKGENEAIAWHDSTKLRALDTDKHKPESVTYTIEGMPAGLLVFGTRVYIHGLTFDESEIETRYV